MACSVTVHLSNNNDSSVVVDMLTDTTQYIIFMAYYKHGETLVDIIVGEKNFRQYVFDEIKIHTNGRICTPSDIDVFLSHHDSSYFSKNEQNNYEQIIKNHNHNETKENNITSMPYQPNITPEIRRFYIMPPYVRCNGGVGNDIVIPPPIHNTPHMYRYSEKQIINNFSKLVQLTIEELIDYMLKKGDIDVQDGWGWKNVIVVSGTNFKVERY